MNTKSDESLVVCKVLGRALKNNSLEIFYQPIYDNKEQRFHSAEALIRCNDPEHGFVSPELLITVAEHYGYIDQITDLVYEKVCKFIAKNKVQDYGIDFIEVNLSPENLKQKDIAEKFTKIRERYGVPASMINLEITETTRIRDSVAVNNALISIINTGIELTIDDYGTGHATTTYLIEIPASIVKIDKYILWAAMKDESAMYILKSTIDMLSGLKKKVVIEGVESKEMVDLLTDINCEMFYQGFYYSKPISGHHFIKFLKKLNCKSA